MADRHHLIAVALAEVLTAKGYTVVCVAEPPGTCIVSYYQTRTRDVASLLIGIG